MELIRTENPEHGGNIYKIAEYLGIPEEKLIDFSASINPLGVSEKVKHVIKKELDNLVNYPDPDTQELRKVIARHHDSDPETIICGNGSTELIYLIPRALGPGRVLITAPAFSEYERACTMSCGLRVASCELKKEDNFEIKPQKFIEAMKGCDMAFLCNPNNPTGHLLGKTEALGIAEAAKEMRCLLVVDEAFIDFCPEASVISDVRDNPYLAVLRSMTKFHAIAGLRIGYGVFHKDLINRIKKFKEPWTVNNLAQKAAIAALDDSSYADETMRLMRDEKQFLEHGFREAGIEFFPSAANYYLLTPPLEKGGGEMIVANLRQKGILVRDCSNFKGLDGSYIRVAVKSREHNKILLKELLKLCRA
ncbi:MAG TPA: threonine-phosphate decarboxylase [Nitrospirae bacterium]|nr:threonine-phosphate decarboxylase [bacterium BMS3Abin06]HDH11277.1 threonine-phosphate decarboxylase [Nitrospirota bacterium]